MIAGIKTRSLCLLDGDSLPSSGMAAYCLTGETRLFASGRFTLVLGIAVAWDSPSLVLSSVELTRHSIRSAPVTHYGYWAGEPGANAREFAHLGNAGPN